MILDTLTLNDLDNLTLDELDGTYLQSSIVNPNPGDPVRNGSTSVGVYGKIFFTINPDLDSIAVAEDYGAKLANRFDDKQYYN